MEKQVNYSTSIIELSNAKKPVNPDAILKVFSDDDLKAIYQTVHIFPKLNARGLMNQTHIPQTGMYRKLSWMLDNGIISGEEYFNEKAMKTEMRFSPVIDTIKIRVDKDFKTRVKFTLIADKNKDILDFEKVSVEEAT